ncbi:MAG TPA: hypothetical protein VGG39_23390 [Polyangiaceae bacterium]|jgi:hypothetical protein
MAAETTTSLGLIIKQIWPQKEIYDELNYGMPGYALMRKGTDLGAQTNIAIGFGTTQGVSTSFADAKGNKQPSSVGGFTVPPITIYSLESVSRQAIALSRGDTRAIVNALDRAAQQAILAWKFEASTELWGNGGGAIGQVQSITNNQLVLTSTDDVVKFDRSMTLQGAPDDGTAATGGPTGVRPGKVLVGAVSRNYGATWNLQTASGNWTDAGNIPGLVVGDYLFRGGTYNNVMIGVGGYVPAADPGSTDSFFGQNRSTDPLRLAGIRVPGTNLTPRESAMRVVREALRNSANPTHYFLNPTNFESLQFELQSAGVLMMTKQLPAPIGSHSFGEPIDGISFAGPGGQVKVFADSRVGTGTGWALELDTWEIKGAESFPTLMAGDGLSMSREEWADSFEIRLLGDLQTICWAPGRNARISLTA